MIETASPTKTCTRCRVDRELDDFPPNTGTRDGRGSWCRSCARAWDKTRNARPERRVASAARRGINVTGEAIDELLDRQGGVCAICREPETALARSGRLRSLCLDHDHETGELRGLLCSRCNTALGLLGDDPGRIRAALDYLGDQ